MVAVKETTCYTPVVSSRHKAVPPLLCVQPSLETLREGGSAAVRYVRLACLLSEFMFALPLSWSLGGGGGMGIPTTSKRTSTKKPSSRLSRTSAGVGCGMTGSVWRVDGGWNPEVGARGEGDGLGLPEARNEATSGEDSVLNLDRILLPPPGDLGRSLSPGIEIKPNILFQLIIPGG
jgi:hypothetical protein